MLDLKRLMFDKCLNQTGLGEILNIPQPEVSKLINGRRDIRQDHIDLLIAHFGEDVVKSYTLDDDIVDLFKRPQSRQVQATIIPAQVVEEIVGEHSTLQRYCDTIDPTAEECDTLCPQRLPYVKSEIVQSRNTNIRQLIESEPHKLEHRSMRQMIGNPNYVQKVITSAMMPLFQPGDMLFVQFLPEDAKIISGAIYLVDTSAYGAMVRQVYVEDDCYCLHSLNPEYKELKLQRDQIYSISLVVRSLRSDFNPPSLAHDTHTSIRKREEQVERLLMLQESAMAEISRQNVEISRQNERMAEERRRQDEERKEQLARQDKLIEMLNEKK